MENRIFRERTASTIERSLAVAGLAAAGAILLLVKNINPVSSGWFPQCPLHAMTGLNCPGCGATRGMHALLNGDVSTALHFNLLLVLYVPLIVYFLLNLLLVAVRGRGLSFSGLSSPGAVWTLVIVLFSFGVLRNLPFYPFTILAP